MLLLHQGFEALTPIRDSWRAGTAASAWILIGLAQGSRGFMGDREEVRICREPGLRACVDNVSNVSVSQRGQGWLSW